MPADVKLLGETALGGETVSGFVFLPEDQRLDLIDRVFIEPDATDGFEQDLMLLRQGTGRIRQRENVRGMDRSLTHTDPFDMFPGREFRRGAFEARDGQVV